MLLAVRISSYGCTWKVWRALKKLELHEAISFVLSKLDIRTLSMNKFLNCTCFLITGSKFMSCVILLPIFQEQIRIDKANNTKR